MLKNRKQDEKVWRAELTLREEHDKYLVEFGEKAKRQGGHRLARTEIIRALIKVLKRLDVDVSEVRDEKELEDRILEAIEVKRKQRRGRKAV